MSSEKIIVKNVGDGLVVLGDTYSYRDTLKNMGGIWNSNLKMGESIVKGWVFPKIKLSEINEFIKKAGDGKIKQVEKTIQQATTISPKDFLSLVSRVERLETELAQFKSQGKVVGKPQEKVQIVFEEDEGEAEEENEEEENGGGNKKIKEEKELPVKRLLHRK